MELHHLRIFLSVFRNRSFSKASVELHLSQPTISDHIKTLETGLHCRLFDRLGRKIIPTPEAETLYNHALEIIEKADSLRIVLGQRKNDISGELVIAASTIPGTYLLPSLIARFRNKHPSVSFTIPVSDSKAVVQQVLAHQVLMGIVGAKLAGAQINYLPLLEDELVVIAAPSFIKGSRITVKDLSRYPMVCREEGSGTRQEAEKILEGQGFSLDRIRVAAVFGSTDAVKQAVKAGLGIAIVSRLSVEEELKHKVLKEVTLAAPRMKRKFYVVTHKKRALPLPYALFLEHLQSSLKIS
jgi:DNA-binding transcriptional LysR family regulator